MPSPRTPDPHTSGVMTLDPGAEDVYVFPASFAQQRLWFLDQFEPGNPLYNIIAAVRMRGALHVTALEQSLQEIVRRHEALRTTLAAIEGKPVQVIDPDMHITLAQADLQALARPDRETAALRLASEAAQRPFHLSQGPLLRTTLLHLEQAEHILLLSMHHIVSDAWSMGVFIRELATLYEAFAHGRPSPLPELPIQYADFAVWQRGWLQGEVLQAQLTYWKQRFGNGLPQLRLPTDRSRPAVLTSRGAKQTRLLPAPLSASLKELCRQEGSTLFMTLLATFKALLYCYTSQDDIVVGTDIANRQQQETEGLIGFFVNQLVLRTDLSGNPTFRELLGRVRDVVLGAYDHQDLPFDYLVETLNPQRDLSRTPLFQVKFVLQNAPTTALELAGLSLSLLPVENRTAKFDLLLNMRDTGRGLAASLAYSTDLFDATTCARMLEHFDMFVRCVVTQRDTRLHTLATILHEADRHYHMTQQQTFVEARHRMLQRARPTPLHVPKSTGSGDHERPKTAGLHAETGLGDQTAHGST